jgi:type VII secretion protein EccE
VLAVRVLRADGWSDEELRRALSGAVRKIVRRLGPVAARPLGGQALLRVLAELAHHDGGRPAIESWQTVRLGDLLQTTFRLRRWPDVRVEGGRRLVPRLLALPADGDHGLALRRSAYWWRPGRRAGRAVGMAGRRRPANSSAAQAPRRLADGVGAEVRRLDGEQLPGLARHAAARTGHRRDGGTGRDPRHAELLVGTVGLMIGANRAARR